MRHKVQGEALMPAVWQQQWPPGGLSPSGRSCGFEFGSNCFQILLLLFTPVSKVR